MPIRIATLNAWALPEPFAARVNERMHAIGERLDALELDAVAFQEVWTPEARRILIDAGRRAGLRETWHNDTSFGGSGLLVLSRLPIESVRFECFALRGQPERLDQGDYYGGKGFAQVRLRTPDGPVVLVDTHLHARYASAHERAYRGLRTGQIVQLAMALAHVEEAVVVAGDFNCWEGAPEYDVLAGLAHVRDVAVELDRREPTVWRGNLYRSRRRKPDRRVDLVFVRDGVRRALQARSVERVFDEPVEIDGHPGSHSNHAGVLAELALVEQPGRVPPPAAEAVTLARELLDRGRRDAERRRRGGRQWAGAGLGCAAVAALGARSQPIHRRRLLRGAVQGAAVLAFAPGVALSVLSELFVPDEIRAFEALAARLASLDTVPSDGLVA